MLAFSLHFPFLLSSIIHLKLLPFSHSRTFYERCPVKKTLSLKCQTKNVKVKGGIFLFLSPPLPPPPFSPGALIRWRGCEASKHQGLAERDSFKSTNWVWKFSASSGLSDVCIPKKNLESGRIYSNWTSFELAVLWISEGQYRERNGVT